MVEEPRRGGDFSPDQALDGDAPQLRVAERREPEERGGEAKAELIADVPEIERTPREERDADPAQEREAVVAAAASASRTARTIAAERRMGLEGGTTSR